MFNNKNIVLIFYLILSFISFMFGSLFIKKIALSIFSSLISFVLINFGIYFIIISFLHISQINIDIKSNRSLIFHILITITSVMFAFISKSKEHSSFIFTVYYYLLALGTVFSFIQSIRYKDLALSPYQRLATLISSILFFIFLLSAIILLNPTTNILFFIIALVLAILALLWYIHTQIGIKKLKEANELIGNEDGTSFNV